MKGPARIQLGLAVVALAIAAFLAFRLHAFLIWPGGVLVGYDERYLAPFGLRMITGGSLPYVDAVSHRGPLLYWMVELFQKAIGPFQWASLRWLALVFTWLTMASCFLVGLIAKKPLAGAIAAILHAYIATCALDLGAGLGVTGELIASPFSLLALGSVAFALERSKPRWRWLFLLLGGALASLAGLSKQTSLSTIAPLLVFTLLSGRRLSGGDAREAPRPPLGLAVRASMVLVLGWSLPLVTVLAVYAHKDAIGSFWHWFYAYNARVYMEPYASESSLSAILSRLHAHPLLTLALLVPLLLGLLIPLSRARSFSVRELLKGHASIGLEAIVALQTAVALFAAFMPLRFWPHYFVSVVPFVGLLVGLRVDAMLGNVSRWPSLVARASMMLALVGWFGEAHGARLVFLREERAKGSLRNERSNDVCRLIDAHSKPKERIFIWGFDGDFYIDCKRLPASRFVFTTFIAGIVPPFWGKPLPTRIVPGTIDRLEADLRSSRPPLILDFYKSLGLHTSMQNTPQLARFLEADYCRLPEVSARSRPAAVWLRRDTGRCPGP